MGTTAGVALLLEGEEGTAREETVVVNMSAQGKLTTAQKIWDKAGAIETCFAMIPQGLFGMLLVDAKFLRNVVGITAESSLGWQVLRIGTDALIFVAAEEGKRRLIRFFNTASFQSIPSTDWEKFYNPKRWTLTGVANAVVTVNISLVFGGLAEIGLQEAGKLLLSYHNKGANIAASVIMSKAFGMPFVLSATHANFLSFPFLHWAGVQAGIVQPTKHLFGNPARRDFVANVKVDLEAARRYLKTLWEDEQYMAREGKSFVANYERVVRSILKDKVDENGLPGKFTLEHIDLAKLVKLARSKDCDVYRDKAETELARFAKGGFAAVVTGYTIAGMSNFYGMGDLTSEALQELFWGFPLHYLYKVIQPMGMLSMALMCTAIIPDMIYYYMERLHGDSRSASILKPSTIALLLVVTMVITGLGGTPNAYQSSMDNQGLFYVIAAALGSFLLENRGFFQQYRSTKLEKCSEAENRAASLDETLIGLIDHELPGELLTKWRDSHDDKPAFPKKYRDVAYSSIGKWALREQYFSEVDQGVAPACFKKLV